MSTGNALSLVDIRRNLHQIPEPGFEEFKTQAMLLGLIGELPQARLEIQTWRTGILVKVRGTNPRRTFGYRTDMDGLPIEEQTGYDFKSTHPGYMHACGHDMHMTIAMGILRHFVQHPIADDIVMIFQPAEEGPGGALPMLQSDEFQAWTPDEMLGLHIAPEYPVGTIATRPGILFANTSELFIDLAGKGGHAAFPHMANDMVVAAAHLVTQLQTIVARNVNPLDSAVVTIGKITGGTKQNIIAETARLEGTIRTLSQDAMKDVKGRIEALVRGIETGFACTASIDWGSNYLQVTNDEACTREFMEFVRSHLGEGADEPAHGSTGGGANGGASGGANAGVSGAEGNRDTARGIELVECTEAMTGEDFGYFLDAIPGFMFWLGVQTPYGLHHAKIEPDERAIDVAIKVVTKYLEWKSAQ